MSIACCYEGCGASVCFTPEVERRLRDTHEWWMCPFGHEQHFAIETDKEREFRKERERYQAMVRTERATARRWREMREEMDEEFGTCPFGCGWRSRSGVSRRWLQMFKHFSKVHGNLLPGAMVYASRKEHWPEKEQTG